MVVDDDDDDVRTKPMCTHNHSHSQSQSLTHTHTTAPGECGMVAQAVNHHNSCLNTRQTHALMLESPRTKAPNLAKPDVARKRAR